MKVYLELGTPPLAEKGAQSNRYYLQPATDLNEITLIGISQYSTFEVPLSQDFILLLQEFLQSSTDEAVHSKITKSIYDLLSCFHAGHRLQQLRLASFLKLLMLDVDHTLLGLDENQINSPYLDPDLLIILQYCTAIRIPLGIATSRTDALNNSLKDSGCVSCDDLVTSLALFNISIEEKLVLLKKENFLREQTKMSSQFQRHDKKWRDCFLGKNLMLHLARQWLQLHEPHLFITPENIGLLDDKEENCTAATNAGFTAIKAPGVLQVDFGYLLELAKLVGLERYASSVADDQDFHGELDPPRLVEIAKKYLSAKKNRMHALPCTLYVHTALQELFATIAQKNPKAIATLKHFENREGFAEILLNKLKCNDVTVLGQTLTYQFEEMFTYLMERSCDPNGTFKYKGGMVSPLLFALSVPDNETFIVRLEQKGANFLLENAQKRTGENKLIKLINPVDEKSVSLQVINTGQWSLLLRYFTQLPNEHFGPCILEWMMFDGLSQCYKLMFEAFKLISTCDAQNQEWNFLRQLEHLQSLCIEFEYKPSSPRSDESKALMDFHTTVIKQLINVYSRIDKKKPIDSVWLTCIMTILRTIPQTKKKSSKEIKAKIKILNDVVSELQWKVKKNSGESGDNALDNKPVIKDHDFHKGGSRLERRHSFGHSWGKSVRHKKPADTEAEGSKLVSIKTSLT